MPFDDTKAAGRAVPVRRPVILNRPIALHRNGTELPCGTRPFRATLEATAHVAVAPVAAPSFIDNLP